MDYTNIQNIIDLDECPLGNANFTELCQKKIDENAAAFILQGAIDFLNN